MEYNVIPFGNIWQNGIFNVPSALVDKYIKLASEYQIKAMLIILSNNGVYSSELIAKKLGITVKDTEEIMEFWVSEGIITVNGNSLNVSNTSVTNNLNTNNVVSTNAAVNTAPVSKPKETVTAPLPIQKPNEKETIAVKETKKEVKSVRLTPPTLAPKDIVRAANENPEIAELLNEAQVVLGRTMSHAENEMIVNLVNFYGLKTELILMILDYCRREKEKNKDKRIGTAYIIKIAENWMDEGIDSISLAEEKLKSIEKSDKAWKEITELSGIHHKNPTIKQREMVNRWYNDFDLEMISIAIDKMKENTESPKLSYVDSILKSWKKKGIKTPSDVAKENEDFSKSREKKENKNQVKISRKPTFNIDTIKNNAVNNTEIKF